MSRKYLLSIAAVLSVQAFLVCASLPGIKAQLSTGSGEIVHIDKGVASANYEGGDHMNAASALSAVNKILYADITRSRETRFNVGTLAYQASSSPSLKIGWVGDMVPLVLATSSAPEAASTKAFDAFSSLFRSLDVMSGNLEGVMSDSDTYQSKCAKMASANCFALKGTPGFASALKQAGFDVMNIANNHSFDFGALGFMDTQRSLDAVGIEHTGAKGKIGYVQTPKGTVAFVGFAQNYQLNSMLSTGQIAAVINEAKSKADIVVATMHAGGEGASYLMVPEGNEVYLGENRGNTQQVARMMIDAGADMVLGSGPHVMRGIEMYKDKVIAYSLGNFLASNKLSAQNFLGISGVLVIDIEPGKKIKSVQLVPARISLADGIPRPDQTGAAINLINHLSAENFAENGVQLDENGVFMLP